MFRRPFSSGPLGVDAIPSLSLFRQLLYSAQVEAFPSCCSAYSPSKTGTAAIMNPPTTSSGQPSRHPPGTAAQRPAQVVPASLTPPTNYQPHTTQPTPSAQAARQYVNAHPQPNPQPKPPRATAFRPPVHAPGKAPMTVMNSTPRPPAPVQAVRPPTHQTPAAPTDDNEIDDQVFKAYVDALAAMDPQTRAALNARPLASNPPAPSLTTTGRASPRPTDVGKVGSGVGEVKTAVRAVQGTARVAGTAKVDASGVKGKSGSPGIRPPQAATQPASGAPSNVGTIHQPPDVSLPSAKPSSTPKPRSFQPTTQPIKPITSTFQTSSFPSSTPHISSATAAAAAAAAAWNARFGPTIDERLFSPTPSRAPVSSSAPTPAPSSAPAASSGMEVSIAPASSSAPPAVGNAAKEVSLDAVAERRTRMSDSETTSSDESSDEDGVNALLDGEGVRKDVGKGIGGKGDVGKPSESVVKGGDAPSSEIAADEPAAHRNGGAKTSSTAIEVAPPSTQPKEKSPATIVTSTTTPANPSSSAVPPTPPIKNANESPPNGTQQPISASSQGKKPLPSRPWKYHALVEEELVDGVWRQVGEVETTRVEVSPAPPSAPLAPSVSKELDENSERGQSLVYRWSGGSLIPLHSDSFATYVARSR